MASSAQQLSNSWFLILLPRWVARQLARAETSIAAIVGVVIWFAVGPLFGWSDAWQLVINTASSVITLIMVFVIEGTQRRDTQAVQLKLDELIRVNREARNELINLEAKPETAIEEIRSVFEEMHHR